MLLGWLRWRWLSVKSRRYEGGCDYGELTEESRLDRENLHLGDTPLLVEVARDSLVAATL
jgi:hypothetical protein